MLREMHGVFVAVNFHGFAVTIILISVIRVTARIDGPHIPLGFALSDPFSHHLARTTTLGDAKGKHAGFISIRHAGHWAHQRQTIRRIWNRAVDHTPNATGAKKRDTRHRILNIPFETFKIIREQLETKVLGHRVSR